MGSLEIYVYCPKCQKASRVTLSLSRSMNQYAINHKDHVIIFVVDDKGAVRSTHVLRVIDPQEIPKDTFDNFAIINGGFVDIVVILDNEVMKVDRIPLIEESNVKSDVFLEALEQFGEKFLVDVIIGVCLGGPIKVERGIEMARKMVELLGEDNIDIIEGNLEYRFDDVPYLLKVINRILSETDPEKRIFITKKIISSMKTIIAFIINNYEKDIVREEIRSILSSPERRDLQKTLLFLIELKNPNIANGLRNLFDF